MYSFFFKQDKQLINTIMPMINKFLKDDIVEVQYSTIENIDKINSISKNDDYIIVKYIMPIIKEDMSEDKKWGFRDLIDENFLKIINELSKEKINTYFYDIILKLFEDM